MKDPSRPASRLPAAARLRKAIEQAEAEGVNRNDMRLKLTLGDVNQLRRDNSLAVADISFKDGVMRFLGVEIEQGGVAESTLERLEAE